MCNCDSSILSSTATTGVSGTDFSITPAVTLTPVNEQGIKLLITTATPSAGVNLPVVITLNGASVPVYDKFGNIVYGNQIYKNQILRGYYGDNGASGGHYQLLKLPHRFCNGCSRG